MLLVPFVKNYTFSVFLTFCNVKQLAAERWSCFVFSFLFLWGWLIKSDPAAAELHHFYNPLSHCTLQAHELSLCTQVFLRFTIYSQCCALLHPEQKGAMSLIWGIHPGHLLFINTPLWSTSLSLSLSFSLTHTPLELHGVLPVSFMNSRNQNYYNRMHN